MARTIRRLALRNLRLVTEVALDLTRINMFVGPMGSGKSTTRLAVEYAILRRCEMTDGRGVGIATLVRHGCKGGSIDVELDDGCHIQCEFPKEKETAAKVASALHILGLTDLIAPALLRGEVFLDRCDADRRSILQRLLGVDLRQESMIGLLNTWDERFPDLGDWLDAQTSRLQWSGRDFDKLAREQRTVAGRVKDDAEKGLARAKARVFDAEGNPAPPAPVPSEALLEAQGTRDDLLRDIGAIDASESPARQEYEAKVASCNAALAQHQAEVEEYQRLDAEMTRARDSMQTPPEGYRPAADLQAELAQHAAHLQALEAEVARHGARLTALTEQRRQAVARAAAEAAPCPTCGHPYNPDARAEIARLDAEIEAARQPAPQAAEIERVRRLQQQTSQEAIAAARYDSTTEAARATLQRIQPRMLELQTRHATWTTPVAPEPPTSREAERRALLTRMREVDQELERLAAVKEAREQWERDFTRYEQLLVETETQSLDWARWDALVKALEPRGLAARISADAVGAWAAEVDAETRRWFGLGFKVEFGEKTWDFWAQRREGWVPQDQLSGGERLLLSAAIQVSLARRTGLHTIFLDEVQRADGKMVNKLLAYLLMTEVQAFLFAAAQTRDAQGEWVRPAAPGHRDISVWWVEEGRFERQVAPVPA